MIFVSGVVVNVAICAVIVRNRKQMKRKNLNFYFISNCKIVFVIASMHTATNCYLFSLAVADLTALLFGKESNNQLNSVEY